MEANKLFISAALVFAFVPTLVPTYAYCAYCAYNVALLCKGLPLLCKGLTRTHLLLL